MLVMATRVCKTLTCSCTIAARTQPNQRQVCPQHCGLRASFRAQHRPTPCLLLGLGARTDPCMSALQAARKRKRRTMRVRMRPERTGAPSHQQRTGGRASAASCLASSWAQLVAREHTARFLKALFPRALVDNSKFWLRSARESATHSNAPHRSQVFCEALSIKTAKNTCCGPTGCALCFFISSKI
jgi:hypothetical protein